MIFKITKLGTLNFLVKYLLPFFTITLISITKIWFDSFLEIGAFLYFNVPILLHGWIGGLKSGILATFLSAFVIFFVFYDLTSSSSDAPAQFTATLVFIIQSITMVFVIDLLTKSRSAIRATNKRILKERKRMQDIIDSLFLSILIISPEGEIIEANRTASTVESNKQSIISKNITDLYQWSYSEDIVTQLRNEIKKVAGGSPTGFDSKMKLSDEKFLDVYISIVPIKDSKNNVEYLIFSATDISERKTYERELQAVEQNYKKLVNSNIIGMVIRNKDGTIIDINDAFAHMLRYSGRDEFIDSGLRWNEVNTFEDETKESQILQSILDNGFFHSVERALVSKTNDIVPVLSSSVLINEERGDILCVLLDISERKELEKKKDEFLSMASHELKTPLTTLKGYVQLLGMKLEKRQEENENFVSRMDKQLHKITDLIGDLLDISRIETHDGITLEKSRFNIVKVVEDVVGEMQPLSEKHKVNLSIPESEQIVEADQIRIGQVVINLISNAFKYSPNSDTVNVKVEDLQTHVRVSVEDFGIGINEKVKRKVFEKFYRIEDSGTNWNQGLGLGLYISSEIILRHGSTIQLESNEGKGSLFYFDLEKVL